MSIAHPKFTRRRRPGRPVFLDLDAGGRQGDRADRRGRRPRRPADRLSRRPGCRATRGSSGSTRRPGACSSSSATTTTRWSTAARRPTGWPQAAQRARDHGRAWASSERHARQPLPRPVDHRRRTARPSRSRRKLKPTHVERTVFGEGDGSDLAVFDTPLGRLGAPVLLGAPAAAVEVRDVRAERAGARRGLAELLALPRRRRTRSGPEVNNAASQIYAVEGQCFVLAPVRDRLRRR